MTRVTVQLPRTLISTKPCYLIGDAAKSQAAMNAHNTVFDAKHLIGRKFFDPSVQSDMKHWPFKVVSGSGGTPIIEVD